MRRLVDEIVIPHTNIGEYMRLKGLGYVTLWVGEGKICLGKYE